MGPLLGLSAPPCYATPPRKDATDTAARRDGLGNDDLDDTDDTEHSDDSDDTDGIDRTDETEDTEYIDDTVDIDIHDDPDDTDYTNDIDGNDTFGYIDNTCGTKDIYDTDGTSTLEILMKFMAPSMYMTLIDDNDATDNSYDTYYGDENDTKTDNADINDKHILH